MTSRAISGSVRRWLAVGGANPSLRERTEATASTAPAAAMRWPVTPLVDVTGGGEPSKTLMIASASEASLSGVEVPWAFTWPIAEGVSPASSRASCMQAVAPDPPGDGAVMW